MTIGNKIGLPMVLILGGLVSAGTALASGYFNLGGFWKKDVTPPPVLSAFSGATSASDGYVDLTITYPADTSDYDRLVVRRLAGATPPASTCTDGTVQATFNRPTFTNQAPYADVGLQGMYYSYRACVYDIAGNLTSSQTITNVRMGWPCAGTRHAEECWYYGAANNSCDTVCSTHGGYDADSCTYAYASTANCGAVLGALGIGGGGSAGVWDGLVGGNPLGCYQSIFTPGANGYYHPDGCASTGSSLGARRPCACAQ